MAWIGRPALVVVAALSTLFSVHHIEAKTVDERVYLIAAGEVDAAILAKIKRDLPGMLPVTAKVTPEAAQPLPEAAYDPPRKQYDAVFITDDISKRFRLSLTRERTLVVTDADVYVPGADFIFGFADPKKGIAIISLARLRNEFSGLKKDDGLFYRRVLKEAVRVLAASRGLDVCSKPACVMSPSGDLAALDKKKDSFCHGCEKALRARYGSPLFKTPLF